MRRGNSQSTNDVPSNHGLNTTDHSEQNRRDPDDLPVPPLHAASISSRDDMHAHDSDDRPEKREPPDRVCVVEIVRLRSADREGPVQRWKIGWDVR